MIENLNPRTFAPFGTVYDHRARFEAALVSLDAAPLVKAAAQEADARFEACADSPIALDFIDGMTVLCVTDSTERPSRAYYLDKPVLLRRGIRFCLLTIGQPGTIRLYLPSGARLQPMPGPASLPALTLSPALAVTRLYTFFYQEKPKGFFFGGEKHAPHELVYVDRGVMHCIVGGRRYTLRQHDLLLCLPHQWHIQYADPDVRVAFVTISFDMACADAAALGHRVYHASAAAIGYLEEMLAAQREATARSAARLPLLLGLLLLALPDDAQSGAGARYDAISLANENHLVDTALRFIATNLTRPLTVAQIAAQACVTPSYLAVLFRRHLHRTPLDMLHQLKLEEARRLIHQGGMTITQVSQHLGFATLQHFSRLFTAYFGLSPRAYARTVH